MVECISNPVLGYNYEVLQLSKPKTTLEVGDRREGQSLSLVGRCQDFVSPVTVKPLLPACRSEPTNPRSIQDLYLTVPAIYINSAANLFKKQKNNPKNATKVLSFWSKIFLCRKFLKMKGAMSVANTVDPCMPVSDLSSDGHNCLF